MIANLFSTELSIDGEILACQTGINVEYHGWMSMDCAKAQGRSRSIMRSASWWSRSRLFMKALAKVMPEVINTNCVKIWQCPFGQFPVFAVLWLRFSSSFCTSNNPQVLYCTRTNSCTLWCHTIVQLFWNNPEVPVLLAYLEYMQWCNRYTTHQMVRWKVPRQSRFRGIWYMCKSSVFLGWFYSPTPVKMVN